MEAIDAAGTRRAGRGHGWRQGFLEACGTVNPRQRERPGVSRTADERDELAPPHKLSSSRGSHSSTSLKSRVVHYSILAHATSATGHGRLSGTTPTGFRSISVSRPS